MIDVLHRVEEILHVTTLICMIGIALSLILLIYRVLVGPSNPDRATALDVIGVCLMATAALTSILLVTTKLNDVILLIGILSFIGTLALAKYLEMGVIIERDRD
ncbi:Na(+)/H(+) antiporter subunit F1 [Pseudogracilibacillus auburnensis]|uniref:Multisubunit sodium/proton antiporter MrpF subunit n=1 Tax=Pseudogracilibacillus auburnensis TaxID=1494959 RepID=A0A2V3W0H2_9BACI|nr:Na(+)/H(+) antiporter subunit F1 [Pseudogracilibacillus auburnensis]MBO1003444.1 Na(+)/H(+) antiporter subunit F1 [Pseudogracilibacillus auburnensis]PXW86568.1 multisubunit sodium/proton antiporter MrpF subunit [Pseudogracilibacillus auburnensis]